MKSKSKRNGNNAGRSTIQNVSKKSDLNHNTVATGLAISDNSPILSPSGFSKEIEAVKVNRDSKTKLIQRFKTVASTFQSIALLAAILAIPIAYWQGSVQVSQSQFERHQRFVELSISIATFWQSQLDQETRSRVGRFTALLNSLVDSDKKDLAKSLLEDNNLINSESIRNNPNLYKLIQLGLGAENASNLSTNLSLEVSYYYSALVKYLNTMEIIAVAYKATKDNPDVHNIEVAYIGAIKQRNKELQPFIIAYREKYNEGRRRPAWRPLDDLANEDNH